MIAHKKAKTQYEEAKKALADQIRLADKDEVSCDQMITDITELFLSGEAFARNEETVGVSSKSLTVLFWNLGNWSRGVNFRVPSDTEYQKLFYKENKPDEYPDHVEEANNLFLLVKNLRAHVILNCEATTLLPHREYLEKHDGSCVLMMRQTCVVWQGLVLMALYDKLVDRTRRIMMTYGMVQNVVCRLLFSKLSGVRLFPVEPLQRQKEGISLVKVLRSMKRCVVLE